MHQIFISLWAYIIVSCGNCRSLLFFCSQAIESQTVQLFPCNELAVPSLMLLCPVTHYTPKDYIFYTRNCFWSCGGNKFYKPAKLLLTMYTSAVSLKLIPFTSPVAAQEVLFPVPLRGCSLLSPHMTKSKHSKKPKGQSRLWNFKANIFLYVWCFNSCQVVSPGNHVFCLAQQSSSWLPFHCQSRDFDSGLTYTWVNPPRTTELHRYKLKINRSISGFVCMDIV